MKKTYKEIRFSILYFLNFIEALLFPRPTNVRVIGISGGPNGGKSTFLGYITNLLTNAGHRVYIVPEAATILIKQGYKPGSVAFQIAVAKLILKMERDAIREAKRDMFMGLIFIICDRTLMDGNGYVTDPEFAEVLQHIGMDYEMICRRYDSIIYFESAAKNAVGFYGTQSNEVRYENIAQAVETCDRTWIGCSKHPKIARIYNDGGTFSQKLFYGYQQSCSFNALPIPLADTFSKRYYVQQFDSTTIEHLATAAVHVTIYYLTPPADTTYHKPERLRSKLHNGVTTYFYTRERQTGADEYTQIERHIDKEQFEELLLRHDPHTKVVHKTLYSFERDGYIYELNIYANPIIYKGIGGVGILKITPTKERDSSGEFEILTQLRPMTEIPLQPKELTDYMIARQ